MTYLDTSDAKTGDATLGADIMSQIDRVFASVGQGFNAYLETRARSAEIAHLNAMSDAELAQMGLKRDLIVLHVFRDRLGF
jgi:hypothetical protein